MAQKMFIANCTRQVQEIHFRLDFNAEGIRVPFRPATRQKIEPGRQICIGNKDFHPSQIESLVQQLTPFGMIAVADVPRCRNKVRQIFNLDKPVPVAIIRNAMDMNAGYLTEEGRVRRRNAAVATNDIVAHAVTNDFAAHGIPKQPDQQVTVEFEQLEQSEAGESRIEEGYRVREGEAGMPPRRPGRPRKAA